MSFSVTPRLPAGIVVSLPVAPRTLQAPVARTIATAVAVLAVVPECPVIGSEEQKTDAP